MVHFAALGWLLLVFWDGAFCCSWLVATVWDGRFWCSWLVGGGPMLARLSLLVVSIYVDELS
jgi:hypothetical protein